jgi:hypothetical protein
MGLGHAATRDAATCAMPIAVAWQFTQMLRGQTLVSAT